MHLSSGPTCNGIDLVELPQNSTDVSLDVHWAGVHAPGIIGRGRAYQSGDVEGGCVRTWHPGAGAVDGEAASRRFQRGSQLRRCVAPGGVGEGAGATQSRQRQRHPRLRPLLDPGCNGWRCHAADAAAARGCARTNSRQRGHPCAAWRPCWILVS